MFSRAKERLMLGSLRLRGLEQVSIHADLAFTVMLDVVLATIGDGKPWLIRSVKHFTARYDAVLVWERGLDLDSDHRLIRPYRSLDP